MAMAKTRSKIEVVFQRPYDLGRSTSVVRRGGGEPTCRLSADALERATRTPAGVAVMTARQSGPATVSVEASGEGADWLLANAATILGAGDDNSTFVSHHGVIRNLHEMYKSLHVLRTLSVFETLVPTVIEQKVVSADAHQAYRRLVKRFGERVPDSELFVPPSPQTLAEMSYADYHECGLERRRAETIRYAAKRAKRIDECAILPLDQAYERLGSLPGIGPWSCALVAGVALGDADAVAVGDFHLSHTVGWGLAGESRADDARMLELLEPYRGQRGRVTRYLMLGGVVAPRRGPRIARRDIARL
jgi:3-methyladenine DNA glycosylase/8-oxoguanine DNA glycosylase